MQNATAGTRPEELDGLSNRLLHESASKILRDAEIARTMPDDIGAALARARVKPRWCSDIRWRMELKRRQYRFSFQ